MRINCLIILSLFLLSGSGVYAESYYLQTVKSAEVSAQSMQKSLEKVKEHKEVKVRDRLEVPTFHNREAWETKSLSLTFCTTCHLAPPHTKNLRSRAFLNMHTEFIACETCHMRPEKVKFEYQWLDYRTQQIVAPSINLFRQAIDQNDIPKRAEEKLRKTDVMIKIAPFYSHELALILKDHEFSKQSVKIWKDGTVDEKAHRRAKIHTPLKEKGAKCKDCHQTQQPIFDLNALGANKLQARRMQKHIVPQFFDRYSEDDQKIRINSLLK